MKKKLQKIIFLIGFFLVSFFVSQNVFAETGDKGIIIERFEYDENNELILSWSVDYGFSEWYQQYMLNNYNYYQGLIDVIYIDQNIQYDDVFGKYDEYLQTDVDPYLKYDLIDCFEVTEYGKRQRIYAQDFGTKTCSMKFTAFAYDWPFYRYAIYPANGQYIKKSDIDAFYGTDALESMSWNLNASNIWTLSISSGGTTTTDRLTMSSTFPIEGSPSPINGVCGDANGSTFDWADFDNQDFCSSGDFYLSGDNGERIVYACEGLNGGTTQYNCSADYYYNGVCGSADKSSFSSLDVSHTGLCSSGYVSEGSFLESGTGWTWVCSGSASSSFCNATKSLISFPEMPQETDCSSLTFPDNLLCNIENLLKTGFLPSASAINDLNNAINQIQQKAPFNYLNIAIEKINNIKSNITQDSVSMSLMGNNSTLNINSLTSDFMPSVKGFFVLMISFGFIFWGIAYIKHFFK